MGELRVCPRIPQEVPNYRKQYCSKSEATKNRMLVSRQVEECDESGNARVSHTFCKDELNLRGFQSAVTSHRGFRKTLR